MNIPETSVRNPVTTAMVFLAVLLIGFVAFSQLPVDLMPEMDNPSITVITTYRGAAPEDVETKVTEILEQHLSTTPELNHINSQSKEDVSIITLTFEWGTDLDTRSNEVRDLLGMAKEHLPDEVDDPRVLKFDISRFPILVYGVMANESFPKLQDILDDEIVDPLKRLSGVASGAAMVPLVRQVNVNLDRERLAAYDLTPLEVARVIERENNDTPGGNVKMGDKDYLVRIPGEFKDVKPMSQIVLASRDGSIIRLSDVGEVEDGFEELQRHITINGGRGGVVMVQKESEANTVEVARKVRKRLKDLVKKLPPDVKLINVMDGSEDIERSIADLTRTLLIGGGLAMLVVLVFLRRTRATIVIGLSIPFSLILTVIMVYFLDYTINMMTMFGMIIAVGMIVDNAIVVLENITRHREEGERASEGAVYGTSEVAMAITASTLTTICIFFPILFVKGIAGIIFSQFAIIVTIALVGSLVSAVALTPMLSATLMKNERFDVQSRSRFFRFSERVFDRISDAYGVLLNLSLNHRKTVIAVALVAFGASLLLFPKLGSEFLPVEDRGFVNGAIHLPVGTRVEETAAVMKELDKILKEEITDSERLAVFTRCGSSQGGISSVTNDEGPHIGSFGVKLVPKVERSRTVQEISLLIRKRLNDIASLHGIQKYSVDTGDPMSGMLLGGERPLTVNIIGNDMEVTDQLAAKIKEIAKRTPGTVDISVSREKGRPEIWVNVSREKASFLGLKVSDVGDTIRESFYGKEAGKYRVHGDEYDIFVRLREPDRTNSEDLLRIPVRLPSNDLVRSGNVSDISFEYGPFEIERKDQGRIVNVTGNVHKRSLGEVVADIEAEIAKMEIPSGVEVAMAGQTDDQREAFLWLSVAVGVGLILVYMIMASQFESIIDPFVVMFSVPFAFTGVLCALFISGYHISIVVFLGVLMLVGIVVNNAIVLVDYINVLRARGLKVREAVITGGKTRLRPVLMTALTTILALVPMAFGSGQGSEIWNPLGLTVMSGLAVSTLVTLILVPVIYSIFERRAKRRTAAAEGQ